MYWKRRMGFWLSGAAVVMTLQGCSLMPKEETITDVTIVSENEVSPNYLLVNVERGDVRNEIMTRCNYTSAATQEGMFQVADQTIDSIKVSLGQEVKAGEVLAELDTTAEKKARDEVLIDKDKLQAELSYLQQLIDLTKQEKNLTYGTTDYLDEELAGYESQKKKTEDDIRVNELAITEAEENIAKRQIRAAMDGTVTYVMPITKGEKSKLERSYVEIAGNSFEFQGTTTDAECFPVGSTQELVMESAGDESLIGTTKQAVVKSVETEESTGITTLTLSLLEADFNLQSGDTGVLNFVKDESKNCLYIPLNCLTTANGRTVVCVPDQEGIRSIREVKTGVSNNEYIEITEGLQDGEKVIR